MLMSTPPTKHFTHRKHSYDQPMPSSYQRHCTPPRLCSDSPSYDSPMLTPSPLRRRPLFANQPSPSDLDSDDLFLQSPYKSPAPAHAFNSYTKPQPIAADDDEGSIFLSSASPQITPFFTPSSSQPLLTPVKKLLRTPSRSALAVKHLNTAPITFTPLNALTPTSRVGVGTKRKSTPHTTPLRPHSPSPLKVASAPLDDDPIKTLPFDRLAPLPGPRSASRTPQTKAETDAYLKKQTATLTRLKINDAMDEFDGLDHDSGCEMDEDDDGLFLGHLRPKGKIGIGERTSRHGPMVCKGKEREEVAEAISPGGHIVKRRARSRPLSAELLEQSLRSPNQSPGPKAAGVSKTRPRYSGPVAFPSTSSYRGRASPASSPSDVGSPLPRRRISGGATQFHPPKLQLVPTRQPLSRLESVSSATLFFGPPIPQPSTSAPAARSRTDTSSSSQQPPRPTLTQSKKVNRHSYAGSGSNRQIWNSIQSRSLTPSPRSSPLALPQGDSRHNPEMDEEDMFFGAGRRDSSFVFSVTQGTPSPERKTALPVKYSLRDSGIAMSDDDEVLSTGSSVGEGFLQAMPNTSTSASSIYSDDGLVTPGFGPDGSSGWPGAVSVKGADNHPNAIEGGVDVDDFIIRTLAAASKAAQQPTKRIPGTPVKKVRMSYLGPDRPWQSAVASKVGLRDDCDFKKVPRKSLPAAFPPAMGKKGNKTFSDQSTDSEGEEESPSTRKDGKYTNLGIGLPPRKGPISALPRNRWLMRRSSSGAFSSSSESTSLSNTPTRPKGADWHLPKPRIPGDFDSSDNRLITPSERSASGSSTSSGATLNSPTNGTRNPPLIGPRHQGPRPGARRFSELFGEEQPGRFDRDFVEVDEVGRGEFGQVIKVQCKTGDDTEVYAIKKSKKFEGARHRLRLREEVDILKHLSQAAVSGRHPNVLAYIDSWEEDESLFIRTELCESGNLAHFLWEYGRVFPRLDEARVWKIIVDLANGLRFIHDAGVIHLDIKPSNVFVTKDGRFKIGDFGMASLWPRPTGPDVGNGFEREGDKLYLAPEVLQGKYGKAADVFSLGLTILETACNIMVPDQGDAWQRLRREDFSQVDLNDSPELLDLIRRMMRTDPSLRISVHAICLHPIVSRARMKMDQVYDAVRATGANVFAASPLASVPRGFLEEILGRPVVEGDDAMDVGP